ncbi:M55 family metallopeptidase [Armatimonas rosea]|uniref:D-amino peptidase n=1 Tax=Armatimonas rosea TaxID=685828 RepID=A0A7W9W7I9_ARMRO|nr:D-amino peptidase [Armatimonas rosea]
MIVWICTDMEGLAGVDHWDQCYHPDDNAPEYLYGREQLTADTNAAIAGAFDAGATEVRVVDGHGRNRNQGFTAALDPRATRCWIASRKPVRWEGLDASVHCVAMVGQHAMAGTLHGFLDHTQVPKELCRFSVNGVEYGELGQLALYAGAFGVPLVYVSGDEACCAEVKRQFPHARTTPTKRGTGWETCELYAVEEVRAAIRREIAAAVKGAKEAPSFALPLPLTVTVEWAYSARADRLAKATGVERVDARTVAWQLTDPLDIFTWP